MYASRFQRLLANTYANLRKHVVAGGRTSYSQCGEDLIVDFLFSTLKLDKVRYLDIGAHHPTHLSNTYFFYQRGASGVCVEPDVELAKGFGKVRPRDSCLNVGIGPQEGEADFYHMTTPTLNTFSKMQAEEYQSYGTQRIRHVSKVKIRNINPVIDENFERAPEFVSLDVEGLDLPILESLDFKRHRPLVFCVETLSYTENHSEQKLNEVIDWLTQQSYMVYADTYVNTIFVDIETWSKRG